MKITSICWLLLLILLFAGNAGAVTKPKAPSHSHLPKSIQLLVVTTDGWDNVQGHLYAFKKIRHRWVLQFNNPIVVGGRGLALGDGIEKLPVTGGPVKHEGDKRSPAGIFTIGTAFGYADKKDAGWIKDHYVCASDTLICVDDSLSLNYNKLVEKDTAKKDYNSFEHMKLTADYYKWGLFVNHNSGKVTPGDGSCIFIHIWENDHTGTDGCTAMTEPHILRLLHWINAADGPLLVQLPADVYQKLRARYGLPELNL
jgi:hypothetical protein